MSGPGSWEYQTVPIDFEVWKALSAKLESPRDTFNQVLRRELGLKTTPPSVDGRAWFIDGVTFPHGTEFRARYKGRHYIAVVRNGALELDGKRFESPSPAAIVITGSSVNGWKFWHCRYPGSSDWLSIDGLRKQK